MLDLTERAIQVAASFFAFEFREAESDTREDTPKVMTLELINY